MSMISKKYSAVVDRLYLKTSSGEIDWSRDEWDRGAYRAKISDNSIKILEKTDETGTPVIVITILSSAGVAVDTFSDEDISQEETSVDGYDGYWSLMSDLLSAAARKASGADAIIDEILSDLGR